MPIEVVVLPHDLKWKDKFEAESALVLAALGGNATTAHHIGSTAIPAIVAKPVIDMLIVVREINRVDTCNSEMERLGYQAKGEFGIPTRRYFRKDNDMGKRTFHVHVYAHGNPQVKRHLAFRDFLRAHPPWAEKYSALKLSLAEKHPESGELYQNGKSDFIATIDRLAEDWSQE
jgi:GrpB-like predicted nucleotidyltransferase (UPF0157 family)